MLLHISPPECNKKKSVIIIYPQCTPYPHVTPLVMALPVTTGGLIGRILIHVWVDLLFASESLDSGVNDR